MKTYISTYLHFDGNCREAMTFYAECLGAEVTFMTVGESHMAQEMSDMKDQIMHSSLNKGPLTLMASDLMGFEKFNVGTSVRMCLVCETKEELKTLYEKLSEGGTATHAPKDEPFGTYGDLVDKYGMKWMFHYAPDSLMK